MGKPGTKKPQKGRVIVRTGCIVCKARRVKCDERKPTCLRCEKAGRICEGYKTFAKTVPPASESRSLVARNAPRKFESSRTRTSSSAGSLSPLPWPSTALFENENQRRYFDIFCNETAKQLSGYLDTTFWDRIVPQACENEQAIRHVVTAMGALDFSTFRQSSAEECPEETADHQFALHEYQKAIQLLREESSKVNMDLGTALMACICCACFESFLGNRDMALSQVYTGINLLRDASYEVAEKIENVTEGSGPDSLSKPWIEQEVVSSLRRLGYSGMSFQGGPISCKSERRSVGRVSIDNMPCVFFDYAEAQSYKELLLDRSWHFRRTIRQHDFEYDGSARSQNLAFDSVDSIVHPRSYIPPTTFEAHRILMSQFKRWKDAFEPLLDHSRTEAGKSNFIMAATLKIHYLCSSVVTENALSMSQTSYDGFLASFVEINTLVLDLLAHPDHSTKRGCYTMSNQYLIPIYVCAMKCRHRPVRQQAMSILRSSPQREGLWDSTIATKILEWVIGLEEAAMDSKGFISEGSRTRSVNAKFDLERKSAWLYCRLPRRHENKLDWKEATITW